MCSAPVIVCGECFYVPVQRGFAEDDHMIEALAPNGANHALHIGPVPRGSRRTKHLLHTHVVDLSGKVVAEDSIPISQQIAWRRVPGERIAKLLGGPFNGRMSRDVEVHYAPSMMGQHRNTYRIWKRTVGTVKKSTDTSCWMWLSRNVRQVWLGDVRCRTIYLLTLVSPMSIPSLSNSPWIRGAHQEGVGTARNADQITDFLRDRGPSGL